MSPRVRTFLFGAAIVTTLIAAAAVAAYTRDLSQTLNARGGWTSNYAAPSAAPRIVCPFTIPDQCRNLEWWE